MNKRFEYEIHRQSFWSANGQVFLTVNNFLIVNGKSI